MKHKWLWRLFLVLLILVFIGGTFAIFTYWNVDEDNKWSTFFSFVSALGIFSILIDYITRVTTEKNNKNNILTLIFERYSRQYTDSLNIIDDFIDEVCELYCVSCRFTHHKQIDSNGLIQLVKEKLANSDEIKIILPFLASPNFTNSDILQLATYNKNVASVLLDTEQCIDNIKNEIRKLSHFTSKENVESTPPILIVSSVVNIERLRDILEDKIGNILQAT